MSQPSYRVLIVEDDHLIQSLVQEVLTDEGFDVRVASHGEEALSVLAGWMPDLILLDLVMPVMDGYAFREAQHRHATAAQVPVLLMSAVHELAAVAQQLQSPAFVEKPFNLDQLLGSVRSALKPVSGTA